MALARRQNFQPHLSATTYTSFQRGTVRSVRSSQFRLGLALTRNPDRYRAVDSDAGFYDLLRVELTSNGVTNTPEFGTDRPYPPRHCDTGTASASRRIAPGLLPLVGLQIHRVAYSMPLTAILATTYTFFESQLG
jgi:hypothetical protein